MIKFVYFPKISSTQIILINDIRNKSIENICYWSDYQTNGIGSRNNNWIGKKGNLFFSFVLKIDNFKDVPLQSFSIYFGWLLKRLLNNLGSKVVLKWPNDLYLINDKPKKIGGLISNILNDKIVTGIGINTKFSPSNDFGSLDINIKNVKILEEFFNIIETKISFSEIINEYKDEFIKTRQIFKIDGELDFDGALIKNNKKVYSRR